MQHGATRLLSTLAILAGTALTSSTAASQDRLQSMPGYAQFTRMSGQIAGSVKPGAIAATWSPDSKAFEYQFDCKWYRFEIASRHAVEVAAPTLSAAGQVQGGVGRGGLGQSPNPCPGAAGAAGGGGRGGRGGGGNAPARGRQFDSAISPDGTHRAIYRDRNLWIADANGGNEVAVTTDGSEKGRIKYGTASWVYGEELGQRTAMWWSPDGKQLAYYRFDESKVPDFYIALTQTRLQTTLDVEAYPKPGVPNPVVDLYIYDVATRQTTRVDVRDGQPFENGVLGHYVYNVEWSRDGSEILFYRTNRRQNTLEFTACAPTTGKCRVVIHEEWLASWLENSPTRVYLADGKRFIWESVRNGYSNYYLYDLSGRLLATLTNGEYEAASIVRVDEGKGATPGVLYYMARDGDNHMKLQLHRVGLDGKGEKRLTDPTLNHSVSLAPNGSWFVDVAQTHDIAPSSRLVDATGKVVAELAKSDLTKFEQLGFKKVEMFTYLAADGKTTLHGMISFPSNFDPSRKYPVLVPVYGGPASASNTARETFSTPHQYTEYGFLVVNLDSRATPGMGKRTLDAIYQKLGQVEIDDMARGVMALWNRPYVDRTRVGMFGSSYGGYSSLMSLLRYPNVFAAASASSPPTDWRNYDTIYTERYMWLPQENKDGYDKGAAVTYADSLRGRLMIYYGTADNNVHPSNAMQIIQALQRAGKSFEVQVGPDAGHSNINQQRMMEFFIENLVLRASTAS